jgi:UDP-glucose 4-epimerase
MRLLVTGGAGYIGSVAAAQLLEAGHQVVALDDLSTGHADAVPPGAVFVRGTVRDQAADVLAEGIDAVLHFAANSLVGESVAEPGRYWSNNLGGTLALLEAMRVSGVRTIVFSSTAAVYGEPEHIPVTEADPARPANPYGATKAAVDETLHEYARLRGLGAVSLRYFNVAGAYRAADGRWLAERHSPETHLIPTVLQVAQAVAVASAGAGSGGPGSAGAGPELKIFGDDYPTPDGTCVRDYIHVADLGRAHVLALGACTAGQHRVYNLGDGTGFSNREVLTMCREVTGTDIPAVTAPRRPGDPAVLVASSARIRDELGWKAEHDLRAMVADAWAAMREATG